MQRPAIALAPDAGEQATRSTGEPGPERRRMIARRVEEAGGVVVPPAEAQGIVWLNQTGADGLATLLDLYPGISWVQLPWAGVETFAAAGLFDRPVDFTCAKGAYATQVAEHALMLAMCCLRGVVTQARTRRWREVEPQSLHDKRVTILGGGGIAAELVRILGPFEATTTVVRRQGPHVAGATRTISIDRLEEALPDTDVLVLALALTPETRHIIGERELSLLPTDAVVVNIARGGHIDQDALVDALEHKRLAAAGLDVTDPEPLPDDHPLWRFDNVLITSHCADSMSYVSERLAERVYENVRRLATGEPLIGTVDRDAGY